MTAVAATRMNHGGKPHPYRACATRHGLYDCAISTRVGSTRPLDRTKGRRFESYRAHRGNCRGQERALHGSGGRLSLNPPKKSRLDKPIAANPSGFRVHGAKSLKVRQQPPRTKRFMGAFAVNRCPASHRIHHCIHVLPTSHRRPAHWPAYWPPRGWRGKWQSFRRAE